MIEVVTYKDVDMPWIYKLDSAKKIRCWRMEIGCDDLNVYHTRAVSGIKDQPTSYIESGWKSCEGKNVGRANGTTSETQALAELKAEYTKKLDRGYHRTVEAVGTQDAFSPMLAEKYTDKTTSGYSQPKLDGIRAVFKSDRVRTRENKPIVSVPHIENQLKRFFEAWPDAVLDGELYNHDLKDDFNTITSVVRKQKPTADDFNRSRELIQYYVYDGALTEDHLDLPFSERIEAIYSAIVEFVCPVVEEGSVFDEPEIWNYVVLVPTKRVDTKEEIDELFSAYLEDGYEGQMVRLDTRYDNKRSKSLLKRKEFISEEFEVVDVLEGQGTWSGYCKRFRLRLPDGRVTENGGDTFGAGVRGTQAVLKELLENLDTRKPKWATVRYFQMTPEPNKVPRFGVVTDWGFEDKRED